MRQAAFKSTGSARRCGPAPARSCRALAVTVHASAELRTRRDLLNAAGAAVLAAGAAPLLAPAPARAGSKTAVQPVDQLGLLQKQGQLTEFRVRAEAALKEVLTAADAPAALRLVLHDAGTYDAATKTGGLDGSIVLPEELGRPENAGLGPIVEKLAQAKAKIDAAGEADGAGPISWADLMVLAVKVSTQAVWLNVKVNRATIKSGGETIAGPAFGASWPVRLGRVDATEAAPGGRVPLPTAPVAEIKAYMATLGVKPGTDTTGFFAAKPTFWERPAFVLWTAAADDPAAEEARFVAEDPAFNGWKVSYERSRKTVTRTDYEVDFIDFFTNLSNLGATFKKDAYLHPETVIAVF